MSFLFAPPYMTILDDDGNPVSGGMLYFYATGTTTPVSVYADSGLVTPLANPVIADAAGRCAAVYLDSNVIYRCKTTTAGGATIRDVDPIIGLGSSFIGFIQAGAGAVARTAQSKMRDFVSSADFATHAAADAAGVEIYNPTNVTSTRANGAAVVANQWGPGRVTTADGNKRGKWFSNVTAAPASLGNHNSIETAFNGDLSHSIFQIEHRITGAATLGQPTTGYTYTPEAYPFYGVLYSASGHNQQTGGNDGRTAAVFSHVNVQQYGQGDAVAYNATGFAASQKVGATHFLAQPAVVLFNGGSEAGANYVYLNNYETNSHDNGYDIAHIGIVLNGTRTNDTGGQSCWWGGVRIQSNGTKAWNNAVSAVGKFNNGIDFAMSSTDFGTNKAAISLKADQRIYGNNYSTNGNFTDGFNGDYLTYSSSLSGWNFVVGGTSIMQIVAGQITLVKPPKLPSTTVAGLPAAASSTGMEYYVTDANATTRLSTVAGGGANFVKVFSNGTNWLIA